MNAFSVQWWQASGKGCRHLHSSQLKLKRDMFLVFFSDVYLLIIQELFSVNSDRLLKN